MRVGGFVIHKDNAGSLAACVRSLRQICSEVVALDSGSTDGSRDLATAAGARSLTHEWQGYGAARAHAVAQLGPCDYVFFLDADEWLTDGEGARLQRFCAAPLTLPQYSVRRRDWVDLPSGRFEFRSERRARLVRRDCAVWEPRWIVHEALPRRESAATGVFIEHDMSRSIAETEEKQAFYALLWAVRVHAEGKRAPPLAASRFATNCVRNALVKGALWRGGTAGWQMSVVVARYHALKYAYLNRLWAGEFEPLVRAFREQRYGDVFALARNAMPGRPALTPSRPG